MEHPKAYLYAMRKGQIEYRYFSNIGQVEAVRDNGKVSTFSSRKQAVLKQYANVQLAELDRRLRAQANSQIVRALAAYSVTLGQGSFPAMFNSGLASAYKYALSVMGNIAKAKPTEQSILYSRYHTVVRSWLTFVLSNITSEFRARKARNKPTGVVVAETLKAINIFKLVPEIRGRINQIATGFNALNANPNVKFQTAYQLISDIVGSLANGIMGLAAQARGVEIPQLTLSSRTIKMIQNMKRYFSDMENLSDEGLNDEFPIEETTDAVEEGLDDLGTEMEDEYDEGTSFSRVALRAKLYSIAHRWYSEHEEADEKAVEEAVEETVQEVEQAAEEYEQETGEAPTQEEVEKEAVESLKEKLASLASNRRSSKSSDSFSAFLSRKKGRKSKRGRR